MTTALDIITGAAKLIGVVFKNETLAADEANDGLIALNELLDSWSNDSLVTTAYTLENFTLTGASSYTIGSSGAFNTTRPITIVAAVIRRSGVDHPLTPLTPEEYQKQVADKSSGSTLSDYLIYDNAYPLGLIKFFPVPTSGGVLYLTSNKPLSNLSLLTTSITMPPGWKRALRYNLAIELAPEYGVEAPAYVIKNAASALSAIKKARSANKAMPFIPADTVIQSSIYDGGVE